MQEMTGCSKQQLTEQFRGMLTYLLHKRRRDKIKKKALKTPAITTVSTNACKHKDFVCSLL